MRKYNIPIFVPHRGCPFDCVFCNQKRITGSQKEVTADDVKDIIEEHLKTFKCSERRSEAAFFGGSFTGIPIEEQSSLLSAAYEYVRSGDIDGIRLSTRPDYISRQILDNLQKYSVTTIELGVQSMDDGVLLASGRGHTSEDVINAVRLIREYPFLLGIQMMTGLPGDSDVKSIATAEKIIELSPDMVRIYPTLTIRDTMLEELYRSHKYIPQTVEEAVMLCKELLVRFNAAGIQVIRLGLQSTEEICETGSVIAGPIHSSFGELVESAVYYDKILSCMEGAESTKAEIFVNTKEISKATGNKRMNIKKLLKEKNITASIKGDENIPKGEVRVICF